MDIADRIDTSEKLCDLASQCEPFSLGAGPPRKRQEFYLYRGVRESRYELLSSLQREAKNIYHDDWKNRIAAYERDLVNRFLGEIVPYRKLNEQYHWFCPPSLNTDTFWYLSVMQHFGFPTRLCDFTSDFWTAIFFAADGANDANDMGLYRLKCVNDDLAGNKLPKDSTGKPWANSNGYDVNQLLGYKIGYSGFNLNDGVNSRMRQFDGSADCQMYGWDVPHFKNARIQQQAGFFVYGVNVAEPLEECIVAHPGSELQKYEIAKGILGDIRRKLEEMDLIRWKVYLDLDKAFGDWKAAR